MPAWWQHFNESPGMMHPDTKLCLISEQKGLGVVAARRIPMVTITWAGDKLDQQFTRGQYSRMEPVYQQILDKYCYRDHDGVLILCCFFQDMYLAQSHQLDPI